MTERLWTIAFGVAIYALAGMGWLVQRVHRTLAPRHYARVHHGRS